MAIDQQSNRTVQAGLVVFEQVDLYLPDNTTRATGVVPANLQAKLHVGSIDTSWPLVSGVGVQDIQVSAGKVYWEEFEAGYYSLRFFPNKVGTWRLLLTWTSQSKSFSFTYDAVAKPAFPGALGLKATFVK